jgi:hypothetical protein
MNARNDVVIRMADLTNALRRILPLSATGELGRLVIQPGATGGTLRFDAYYAGAEIAAEGLWTDAIEVNARIMRGFVRGKPSGTMRFVFFEGRLAVNGSTIDAKLADPAALENLPPKRRGRRQQMPWLGRSRPHSR